MGEKWDNSTPRVMQKTVKELEEMEKDLDRKFCYIATGTATAAADKAKERRR